MCLGSDVSDDRKIPKPSKWQSGFHKPFWYLHLLTETHNESVVCWRILLFASPLLLIESFSVALSTTNVIPQCFSIGICFPSLLSWSLCCQELHSKALWYDGIFTLLPHLCFCPFKLFELQWKHHCERFDLTWSCVLLNVTIKPGRKLLSRVEIWTCYSIWRDREICYALFKNSYMCYVFRYS